MSSARVEGPDVNGGAARFFVRMLVAASMSAACATALAADYKSIGNDPAILYDAPTLRGTRVAVAPRGMPVEVIVAQGDWARIRDSAGAFTWVERRSLVDKRTVVVAGTAPLDVRASADDAAPVLFRVSPGVLLEQVAAPSAGWVGVRHRDGQSGFVRVANVWGE